MYSSTFESSKKGLLGFTREEIFLRLSDRMIPLKWSSVG